VDDTCEIWQLTWVSNGNEVCWLFEVGLLVDWDSSSI
jgi:hypothetical protein